MNNLDLLILFGTLFGIVAYGVWKTRKTQNIEDYLRGDNSLKWGTIGLSVMATQASAITFISTPGQGYESGMAFVQNYFGLPLALIIVSAVFIPIYYKLKIYTAYEYLETRFDVKTRILGAALFLVQRGLAAGITIYAPAIIISTILDWDLTLTILMVGLLVMVYTFSGGTKAVSLTQKHQMTVILLGMFLAFGIIIYYISEYTSFAGALTIAGTLGKLNAVDFDFNFEKRYTIWSGLTGGLFLALSYFGTDQSQVQRYIGGKNPTESKMGLMFNAVLKIPMQFFILLTGVMVYVFFIFYQPPLHFKQDSVNKINGSEMKADYDALESRYQSIFEERKSAAVDLSSLNENNDRYISARERLVVSDQALVDIRKEAKEVLKNADPAIETKDSDYVFLTFILNYLPHGIIGLLIAVIFSAAMSSTSSELNSLASTSAIDFYKRLINKNASAKTYLNVSRLFTLIWGAIAILFAIIANNSENLIEAVNIIGSIFYGTILGIFLVAFFMKWVNGTSVFIAAVIAELIVISSHILNVLGYIEISYLMYNVIGCFLTMILSAVIQAINGGRTTN
ncbi:MAG: sodium:solute symporter [bacterium]|nr:sodium:solute symporter [bacterium]